MSAPRRKRRHAGDPALAALPRRLASDGGAPLYRRVHRALRDALARGAWPIGGKLPAESAIGTHFAVSRITVRQALDLLAAEGLIRKQKARHATVTARQPAPAQGGWRIDSIDDIVAVAGDAALAVLSWRREPAPPAAAVLGGRGGLPCLRSLLLREGRVFARSIIYFHPAIGAKLRRRHFDDVIVFRVMQRELDVRIADVEHTVRAERATEEDSRALGGAAGDPIVETRLVYRDERGRAVEVAFTRYPAERYSLTYSLTTRSRHG